MARARERRSKYVGLGGGQGQAQEPAYRRSRGVGASTQQAGLDNRYMAGQGKNHSLGGTYLLCGAGSTETPAPAPTRATAVWTSWTSRRTGSKPERRQAPVRCAASAPEPVGVKNSSPANSA